MRRGLLLSGILLAALVGGGLAGAAPGAGGELRYVQEPVLEPLGAETIAISADGRVLYLLGGYDNRTRLAVVVRDPATGKLSRPAGRGACVRPWYTRVRDCVTAPGFNNSRALAVTADGRDVAVGAASAAQIALFRRDPVQGLRFRSCVGGPVPGFACATARGLDGAVDMAFSPDGRNLYVAVRRDPGVTRTSVGAYLTRSYALGSDGTVAPVVRGCVSVVVRLANCTFLAKRPRPVGAAFTSLAVSPDGRWIYAAGQPTLAFRIG